MNKTKIEWTDYTWNPVTGCNKVSQGCKNCYAEKLATRFWGDRKFTDVQMHDDRLCEPLEEGEKLWDKKVFVCDVSDLFHEKVPFEFIAKIFVAMSLCPNTIFQIVTKRPDRALEYFRQYEYFGFGDDRTTDELMCDFNHLLYDPKTHQMYDHLKQAGWHIDNWSTEFGNDSRFIFENDSPLKNVWIGVSCENQQAANERIPLLIRIPAAVRFLSCEPLIGHVDLNSIYIPDNYGDSWFKPKIHWVIAGGESGGSNARMMHPDWLRSLRDQCAAAGVPFFFKQWGEYLPLEFDAQPPFRSFASTQNLIDGHAINVIDPQDPMGKPGKYMGRSFVDAMESIVFCEEKKVSHCDFLRQGNNKKFKATLDGKFHREFPMSK